MLEKTELESEDEAELVRSILSEISAVKGEGMRPEHYYPKSCSQEIFRRLYEGYENELRRRHLLDFDDMLSMCWELFSQRKDILGAWQEKYKYILVDEFQDINRLQYEIVKMLALPENNLFIVGDDDQSIYRFRGAKPELMLGFEKDYPGAERILLGTNYRSRKPIVDAAGSLSTIRPGFQRRYGRPGERAGRWICGYLRIRGRRISPLRGSWRTTPPWAFPTGTWR